MKTHNASKDELMKSDLEHYEKISNKAMEWHNTIPKAIIQYYNDEDKITRVVFFILGVAFGFIGSYWFFNCA